MDDILFNFFAYLKNNEIRRIPLSQDLQKKMSKIFNDELSKFLPSDSDKIINFTENAGYKPDCDEVFVIYDFNMPQEILNAVKNPLNNNKVIEESEYDDIKAIICGTCVERNGNECYTIIFIVFDKRKIVPNRNWISLILYRKEFNEFKEKLLIIDRKIDAVFKDGNLYFRSLYCAKRIFLDIINDYYREATDEEVKKFSSEFFGDDVSIPEDFLDTQVRKQIFEILRSGVSFDFSKVKDVGEEFGLNLELNNNRKLKLPNEKRDFKKLIKLLNDNLYESKLTRRKYETNSKKKLS